MTTERPTSRRRPEGWLSDARHILDDIHGRGQWRVGAGMTSNSPAIDRRRFLTYAGAGGLTLIGASVGISGCTPPPRQYYVSNGGDDSSAGQTPENSWQSIAKVNDALQDGTIRYGDSVLFRRGDEFFGSIGTLATTSAARGTGSRITLSAYGDGNRPKISGYKLVTDPSAWEPAGDKVWRVNLTDEASYGGNVINDSANTGFLRIDGSIHGAKKWSLEDVRSQWDFFNDSTYLYVWSDQSPTSVTNDFRVAIDGTLITGYSRLTVRGLELVGSGGHGYRQTSATDTEVVDCRIHEIGGAQLIGADTDTTRYGNGVELWMGSSDAVVTQNEIFEVYDVACTMQGAQEDSARSISNCHITANKIWNCCQAFEVWGTGSDTRSGSGFRNCTFTENTCINGGQSWSYAVREDQAGKGNFLMAYSQELPVDIRVERNIFFDARDCYVFVNTNNNRFRDGYVCDENVIGLRRGTLIQAQSELTIEQSAEFVARTGQDAHSRWMLVPPSVVTPDDALKYVESNADALKTP
jgi:Right handed beta helix region